jgi:hypothetical protein
MVQNIASTAKMMRLYRHAEEHYPPYRHAEECSDVGISCSEGVGGIASQSIAFLDKQTHFYEQGCNRQLKSLGNLGHIFFLYGILVYLCRRITDCNY